MCTEQINSYFPCRHVHCRVWQTSVQTAMCPDYCHVSLCLCVEHLIHHLRILSCLRSAKPHPSEGKRKIWIDLDNSINVNTTWHATAPAVCKNLRWLMKLIPVTSDLCSGLLPSVSGTAPSRLTQIPEGVFRPCVYEKETEEVGEQSSSKSL